MVTEYPGGFTEAMIRNIRSPEWEVATLELSFEPWAPDVPDIVRFGEPSPVRVTVACREDRGVLFLSELHVPLASEISWGLRRLGELEAWIRRSLPAEHRESEALTSAVVLYADRTFDMVPDEERLALVENEETPEFVLDELALSLLPQTDPDEVYALFDSLRQLGSWRSREDCLARYAEQVDTMLYRLAS